MQVEAFNHSAFLSSSGKGQCSLDTLCLPPSQTAAASRRTEPLSLVCMGRVHSFSHPRCSRDTGRDGEGTELTWFGPRFTAFWESVRGEQRHNCQMWFTGGRGDVGLWWDSMILKVFHSLNDFMRLWSKEPRQGVCPWCAVEKQDLPDTPRRAL